MADANATIAVRGAREHNLAAVDLDLPRAQLIVLCGVSGSGKSSLAFDTLFVEGQRRYLEALAAGRPRGPSLVPPRVDAIDGLPPTLALPQRAAAYGPRSTVGSVAEIEPVLRVLFARAGTQHCPRCGAAVAPVTHDEIVAALVALPSGTRLTIEAPLRLEAPGERGPDLAAVVEEIERAGFSRIRLDDEVVRVEEVTAGQLERARRAHIVVDRIRIEPDRGGRIDDSVRLAGRAGRGVVVAVHDGGEQTFVSRPYCLADDLSLPPLEPSLLAPTPGGPGACPACEGLGVREGEPCTACSGSRLSDVARAVRWRGLALPDLARVPLVRASELLLEAVGGGAGATAVEATALVDVQRRVDRLLALRLGDVALGAPMDRLSGSQVQRVRLARQVATRLSGVLVVLDEPVAGLEPALVEVVVELLRELVAAGNTVVAVEHAGPVIRAADRVIEFGPGAGRLGGRVVYEGPTAGLLEADTPTGRWLSGRCAIPARPLPPDRGAVVVSGRWLRGRAAAAVRVPRGRLVAVTGPAGSGKSALLRVLGGALTGSVPDGVEVTGTDGLSRPILADRAAARAARSMPATYVGLWDVVRDLLASTRDAAIRGLDAAAFSLNAAGGRCEGCKGTGEVRVDLGPLPDVVQVCQVCEGRRFQRDVLEVRWKGLDAAELLAMSAGEAAPVLAGHPRLEEPLRALNRVGLGYVPLGQPVHTLSGGEARLLALARELARASRRGADDTVHVLDDPTVGLHPSDVANLVALLRTLCEDGASAWLGTVDPLLVGAVDEVVVLPPEVG
jgi:excinuclease ABC subunit A